MGEQESLQGILLEHDKCDHFCMGGKYMCNMRMLVHACMYV